MKTKLLMSVVIGFSFVSSNEKNTVAEIEKPNIIFILADDLGVTDLSALGSKYYDTPHIDQIAEEGFVFTQGYSASRVCSPARASIMTGKFTASHGITDWIGAKSGTEWRSLQRYDKLLPAAYNHSLSAKDTVLAEALKAAGYRTFFAGKWHLGGEGSLPEDHGFDINVGGWDKGAPIGGYFSPWNNPKLPNHEDGENLSMRLANETINFINENPDGTFFAFLSFYAVHGPIETTREKWEKYRNKAERMGIAETGFQMERNLPIRVAQDNPVYAGLVESMDDAVGAVLNYLKSKDLDKNTIIVFTSDNGGVASGDAFSTANLPYRGGKGYQWEGGLRVPVFIKAPGFVPTEKDIDYPVIGTDYYPTLLDLAGIPPKPHQHEDGISLKPLMERKALAQRPLFWHYPHYGNQGGEPASIIREGDWKLIHYWEDGRNELYNVKVDIDEQIDMGVKHPEIEKDLSKKLDIWLKKTKANKPKPDPDYDKSLAVARYHTIVNEYLPKLEQERFKMLAKDFVPNQDWWGSITTKD